MRLSDHPDDSSDEHTQCDAKRVRPKPSPGVCYYHLVTKQPGAKRRENDSDNYGCAVHEQNTPTC
jgi:hypothetical protein